MARRLRICCSNGKTDRRILQQRALDSMKPIPPAEKEAIPEVLSEKPAVIPGDVFELPPTLAYQEDRKPQELSALKDGAIFGSRVAESDSEVSSLEKQDHVWSGYEDDILPDKTQPKVIRNLRHQIFSLYRRLFGVVFVTNMAVFISVVIKGTNAQQLGGIVVANLFCAILMRQDYVINAFFNVFCSVPSS